MRFPNILYIVRLEQLIFFVGAPTHNISHRMLHAFEFCWWCVIRYTQFWIFSLHTYSVSYMQTQSSFSSALERKREREKLMSIGGVRHTYCIYTYTLYVYICLHNVCMRMYANVWSVDGLEFTHSSLARGKGRPSQSKSVWKAHTHNVPSPSPPEPSPMPFVIAKVYCSVCIQIEKAKYAHSKTYYTKDGWTLWHSIVHTTHRTQRVMCWCRFRWI